MDYVLTPDQQATVHAVETVLLRGAGPRRARALAGEHDEELLSALLEAGYLDLATDPDAGPLEAALVTETAARRLAAVNVGARGLVAPLVLGVETALPPRVALASAAHPGPVRFGADADLVLVLDGEDVRLLQPASVDRVDTGYVVPYGRIDLTGGEVLPGAGPVMGRWWRVALAAEIAGLLDEALKLTTEYLTQRRQFGVVLGSLQALQHRLAECHVWVAGTTWSARVAAWRGDDEAAATAATYAGLAARHVAADMHQLTGAISFTAEHDLHLWTMRAQALRTEMGGIGAHARAASSVRWGE